MQPKCAVILVMVVASAGIARAEELARQIDQRIDERLEAAGVPKSPPADDAEFVRRVYLDLHGVIPPRSEVASFLESSEPDKRARLIDQLLANPRFGEHLADIWDAWLLPSLLNRRFNADAFTIWLAKGFN